MTETTPGQDEMGSPQGRAFELATADERRMLLDRAFDYRGDVTLHLAGGRTVTGYVFDRRVEGGRPCVRLIPSDSEARVSVAYDDIEKLVFSDRDPAAGKSWETWVRKYVEKKLRGEEASIHAEELEG